MDDITPYDLPLSSYTTGRLKKMTRWSVIVAVFFFIIAAINFVRVYRMMNLISFNAISTAAAALITQLILNAAETVFAFLIGMYLFRFSQRIKTIISTADQEGFNNNLVSLLRFFIFYSLLLFLELFERVTTFLH